MPLKQLLACGLVAISGLACAQAPEPLTGGLSVPATTKPGQRERLMLQAVPCEGGCPGVLIKGLFSTDLHQSWGALVVQSLDGLGRVLQETSTPPLQGQFNGAALQWLMPVHPAAKRVQVYAEAIVRGSGPAGGLRWQQLQVSPAVYATLAPAGQPVVQADAAPRWQLTTAQPLTGAKLSYRLSNAQGKVVDEGRQTLSDALTHTFNSAPLPSGYYQLNAELQPVTGTSLPLTTTLVVLPASAGLAANTEGDVRIGVDAVLSWSGGTDEQVQRSLRTLKALGVGAVRDRLRWRDLQPSPKRWRPQRELDVARMTHKAGLQLLWTFHDAPDWSRGQLDGPEDMVPATDLDAIEAFGRQLGETLGEFGQAIEFWNEPNSVFFQGDALLFANGYKAFSRGLLSARPEMLALYGAPIEPVGGPFMQLAARNGLGRWAPLANHHYYGPPEGLLAFRKGQGIEPPFLAVHGQGRAWLTETGASVSRAGDGSLQASERQQADYLARQYAEALSAGYERVYWLSWHELPEASTSNWGLLRADGSPRPAMATLGLVAHTLKDAQPAGVLRTQRATVHLFQARNGSLNAVAWGRLSELPATWLATAAQTLDVFGQRLASPSAAPDGAPVFIRGLAKPPLALTQPAPAARRDAPAPASQLPRLLATVQQGGRTVQQTRANASTLPIVAGQPFVLRLHPLGSGGTLVCDGGKDLNLLKQEVVDGDTLCHHATTAQAGPALAVGARLLAPNGDVLDSAWVALGQQRDRQARLATVPGNTGGTPLASALTFCKAWIKKSSANLDVTVQGTGGLMGPCDGVDVVSQTRQQADTWVFPALPTLLGLPSQARSLRIRIAALPGVPVPPQPLMVQFVNDKGTWMASLGALSANATLDQEVDLALANPAPWRPTTPPTFEPASIRTVMLGWGGHTTQAGQRYGYRILEIKVYP